MRQRQALKCHMQRRHQEDDQNGGHIPIGDHRVAGEKERCAMQDLFCAASVGMRSVSQRCKNDEWQAQDQIGRATLRSFERMKRRKL